MHCFTRSRPVLGAFVIAAVAAGCSDRAVTSVPSRSLTPPSVSLREAVPVTGRHIFVLNGAVPSDFSARVSQKGGTVVTTHADLQMVVTEGLSDSDATVLAGTGQVARDVVAQWAPTPEQMGASPVGATISDESAATVAAPAPISELWNMEQIHAPAVWPTKKVDPAVKVAILDSGIDPTHPLLAGLVDVADSRSFVGAGPNCASTSNFVDDFFHGTFVSGIVASRSANVTFFTTPPTTLHFSGVAPNATLVAVKVLNQNGQGSFSDLVCGLIYASSQLHAQVINMSLGATFLNDKDGRALQAALARVFNFVKLQGTTVISAAGNDGVDIGGPHGFISLPCEAGPQLCVSATTSADLLASYSNYGRNAVDVAAPGGDDVNLTPSNIFSQLILGLCPVHAPTCGGSFFIFADGTSASAPHVTGLATLLISQPTNARLVPGSVMSTIRRNADDIGSKSQFGAGRINVARTLGIEHNGRAIGLLDR